MTQPVARSSSSRRSARPSGAATPRRATTRTPTPTSSSASATPRSSSGPGSTPAEVEDVIAGCVQQYGEQMFNVGRNAWLQAGLPIETPATTVDRQCGSAQQAVNFGAALIAAGVHDVVIGGGVEHMGHVPMGVGFNWVDQVGSPWPPELMERYNLIPQGLSAEMIADQWEIPRSELDELAVRSHRLAHQATEEGRFERETIPFQVNGDTYVSDQGIRPETDAREALAAQAGVQARRQDHGGQRLADLRRRRRGAADVGRQGEGARADPARPHRRPDDRRRRPGDHAHRPDPRHAQAARAQRDDDRRHRPRSRSTRRSRPSSPRGSASSSRTWTASTSTAARWRSATRSARPARGC